MTKKELQNLIKQGEKNKAGNSNIRNSTIVTYIAKGLLPYRGIGTGIRRAYDDWDQIELNDDRDACTFTVTVKRPVLSEGQEVIAQ